MVDPARMEILSIQLASQRDARPFCHGRALFLPSSIRHPIFLTRSSGRSMEIGAWECDGIEEWQDSCLLFHQHLASHACISAFAFHTNDVAAFTDDAQKSPKRTAGLLLGPQLRSFSPWPLFFLGGLLDNSVPPDSAGSEAINRATTTCGEKACNHSTAWRAYMDDISPIHTPFTIAILLELGESYVRVSFVTSPVKSLWLLKVH